MTPETLDACVGCGPDRASLWAPALTAAMDRFGIDTNKRIAAFLAQVAHESDGFRVIVENLNYSAAALHATWPEHFSLTDAEAYAHQPMKIANRAYANRMGNGDEASGDGWFFRGRGPIQTTGRDDYRDFGSAVGFDAVGNPSILLQPSFGSLAAGWEWNRSNLNFYADEGTEEAFIKITKAINGGILGEPDRWARYQKALTALGVFA